MKDNNDAARRENKKALPKFALIITLSLVGGVALGLALVFLRVENLRDALAAAGAWFTRYAAAPLLVTLPLLELAICLPIYFGAKKQLSAWDGEDESVGSEIEARLAVCVWITGLALIANLFLLAAMTADFVNNAGTPRMMPAQMFFSGLGAFLAHFAVCVVLQQKLVDLTKTLNPEKHGSVYDTKFQKKWLDSCDEAERAVIGQCAYKAYQAVSQACLALWLVFLLGGMFFDWGFLPVLAVCVIWGVGQSVYSYWCLKLGRPGGKL